MLEGATEELDEGDPCASTPSPGDPDENAWTTYSYDALGNMITMTDAEDHTTAYGYDESGRLATITDANGGTTTYEYDDLGRRVTQSERGTGSMSALVEWTYFPSGRIHERTTSDGTTTYSYDELGKMTSAATSTSTIEATYDRLGRPVTVTDGSTSTTYDYSDPLAPSWTDPSGTYTAHLDGLGRQIELEDPVHGMSTWTWSYRADGQPELVNMPTNLWTAYAYDDAGRMISTETVRPGHGSPLVQASYAFEYSPSGNIVSENSTIDADPHERVFGYDSLGRLSSYTPDASDTTAYGWGQVPNRVSVQEGSDPATNYSFDPANRLTADSTSATYGHDDEGRLTARPGQTLIWNDLGQLLEVKNAAGTTTIAAYTYDALDRLQTVSHPGEATTELRYVGLTSTIASIDGTLVYNDWIGERLFTSDGTTEAFYGTNAHGDVTWTSNADGDVSAAMSYDPWGNLAGSAGDLPPFRFQGSWFDPAVGLSWMITRWYAPGLGRFISEDSLLGDVERPDSLSRFAYGSGNPVSRYDPDGRYWYSVPADSRLSQIAQDTLGTNAWKSLLNANRNRLFWGLQASSIVRKGTCIDIPTKWLRNPSTAPRAEKRPCNGGAPAVDVTGRDREEIFQAQRTIAHNLVEWGGTNVDVLFNFRRAELINIVDTQEVSGRRPKKPKQDDLPGVRESNDYARQFYAGVTTPKAAWVKSLWLVGNAANVCWVLCVPEGRSVAIGQYIFINGADLGLRKNRVHEYIHVVQWEGLGLDFGIGYVAYWLSLAGDAAGNPMEAPAYLWQHWTTYFPDEPNPWTIWRRPDEKGGDDPY